MMHLVILGADLRLLTRVLHPKTNRTRIPDISRRLWLFSLTNQPPIVGFGYIEITNQPLFCSGRVGYEMVNNFGLNSLELILLWPSLNFLCRRKKEKRLYLNNYLRSLALPIQRSAVAMVLSDWALIIRQACYFPEIPANSSWCSSTLAKSVS